jgi:hypothetical protein
MAIGDHKKHGAKEDGEGAEHEHTYRVAKGF